MLTKDFTPTICRPDSEGNPAKYEGFVKIRIPDYDERQEFFLSEMEDVVAKAAENPDNAKEEAIKALGAQKMLNVLRSVKKKLGDWILEIQIKRLDDGFMFTELEAVRYDSEVGAICQEIAIELLGKYRWGNQNTQPS